MRDQSRLAAERAASSRYQEPLDVHAPLAVPPYDHPPDAIMIEHDLLHWAWGDRDRRAGLRVISLVQLPCVAEVLGVHLLRSLLHCTALPVSRPRRLVACRARVHRLPIKEKTAHWKPVA